MDSYYRGKNVLMFGGLGFIGRSLIPGLIDRGSRVTIVERNAHVGGEKHKAHEKIYRTCNVVDLDPIKDFAGVESYLAGSDIVLNLIFNRHPTPDQQGAISGFDRKLLELCKV